MNPLEPSALSDLHAIVGQDGVVDDAGRVQLARTTLPDGTFPRAAVRPRDREQIQQIVLWANQHRIPIYPISTGKNWGYGDACAPKEGCVIVDLSRMTRIVEVNAELAYAVIEPGVTQGQMVRHLDDNKIPLAVDATGAGPDGGIVGNILERGFGHSPYGDRFYQSCAYEVVLPNGKFVRTGFGSTTNGDSQHIYKWGAGPSIDGLLTQGNFGIVTRMTVWLMPRPECAAYYIIGLKDKTAIGALFEALRPLYLCGTLHSLFHCGNDGRLLSTFTRFPWERLDGKKALEEADPALYQSLLKQFHVRAWTGAGILGGSAKDVAAAKSALKKALKKVPGGTTFIFLGPKVYALSQRVRRLCEAWGICKSLVRDLAQVCLAVEILSGHPSYKTLKSAHWRSRQPLIDPSTDPLDTQAGLVWISPALPLRQKDIAKLLGLLEAVYHEFGFEFQVTLTCVNPRAACAVTSVCFDKTSEEETARARACQEKALRVCFENGYPLYRVPTSLQKAVAESAPQETEALRQLQKAWDPQGILAPGRYTLRD